MNEKDEEIARLRAVLEFYGTEQAEEPVKLYAGRDLMMAQRLKFFRISSTEKYLFGLEGDGKVWRAVHTNDPQDYDWQLIYTPVIQHLPPKKTPDPEERSL